MAISIAAATAEMPGPSDLERQKEAQLESEMGKLLVELSGNGRRAVRAGVWTGVAVGRGIIKPADNAYMLILTGWLSSSSISRRFAINERAGLYRPSQEAVALFGRREWENAQVPRKVLEVNAANFNKGLRYINDRPVFVERAKKAKCGHSACVGLSACGLKPAASPEDFFSAFSYG